MSGNFDKKELFKMFSNQEHFLRLAEHRTFNNLQITAAHVSEKQYTTKAVYLQVPVYLAWYDTIILI